ncbi:MAG TPA: efflux RND transporter periplasmic adaptor subunit [Thermoanaerobaculia bacterium]|nr:efflux RND transporter periplasmic adaptor subunit [Thermoanaerobaculia bacterium]
MASKRKKKVAIFSAIGLALVVVIAFVAMKAKSGTPKEPKLPAKVGKAEIADIQVKVTEVGNVQPEVKVDVKSAVSGKVIAIAHRDGDSVKSGDVLARVEPDLNQAQSLADVKNALSAARIRYDQAKKNYAQDNSLFNSGLLAGKQQRDSEAEYLSAKQEYEKTQEKYNLVEKSGIPINQSAEKFQGSNVVAPMDGVVLTKNVEIGESITSGVSSFNAGTVLFTVADVSKMIVKAGVNEVDIGKVRVGMPVKVTLDAYQKVSFAGRVDRIAPAVRLDDKVRVFDVEIRLDAQGRELRSGMTANIEMIGEKKPHVLTVPVEAVFQRDEGEIVFVKKQIDPKKIAEKKKPAVDKDGKPQVDKDAWKQFFEKRVIVTGLSDNARVEIVKGLKAGEEVALEDPTLANDKKKDESDD